jgi:hypothetical protein
MQTLSQRIEVQFPPVPAATTLIGVTNHGITILERDPDDLYDVMVRHRVLPFGDESLERRGVPESALHD